MIQGQQMSAIQGTSRMQLHYFNIRGTSQPIRNLLYHLDIDFDDIVFDKNNANSEEVYYNMNFPYLVDKDIKIHETIAILYYICYKYQKTNLVGHTPQAIARIQEIMLKFNLQRKKIMGYIFQMFNNVGLKKDPLEQQKYIDFTLKKAVNECKFLEFCLNNISKNKKFVLDTITLVDFVFYEQCFYICGFFQQYISKQSILKNFIEFKNNFENLPFFKKKKKEIEEKYLFHAFNNDEMNFKILQNWHSVNYKNLLKYPTS